jgi:hypothetical protein
MKMYEKDTKTYEKGMNMDGMAWKCMKRYEHILRDSLM